MDPAPPARIEGPRTDKRSGTGWGGRSIRPFGKHAADTPLMPGTKAGGHAATKKRDRPAKGRSRFIVSDIGQNICRLPFSGPAPSQAQAGAKHSSATLPGAEIRQNTVPGRGGGSSSARLPPSAPGRRRPCRLPAGSGTTRPDPMARHAGHPPAPVRPMRGSAAKLRSLSNPPRRAISSGHRSRRRSGRIPRPWNPCRRPAHTCPASDSGPQRRQSGRGRPPADRE